MSAWIEPLDSRRLLAAGDLDASYGTGGIAADTLPPHEQGTATIVSAVQAGDRILIGDGAQLYLARYTADGSRDPNFAGTAILQNHPRGLATIKQIDVLSNDRIVVAGLT